MPNDEARFDGSITTDWEKSPNRSVAVGSGWLSLVETRSMSPPSLRLCCRLPTVRERLAALVKHPLSDRTRALGRFIPARAGNTPAHRHGRALGSVHPRPRGEHPSAPARTRSWIGSSPPARGTPQRTGTDALLDRFIPARAGNTAARPRPAADSPVHPRPRGEHPPGWNVLDDNLGSSPPARGTLGRAGGGSRWSRFIPARAGNTNFSASPRLSSTVHPRPRGEH